MSTPRPTPETDAAAREGAYFMTGDYSSTCGKQLVHISVSRRLERERDEARDRLRLLDWTPVTERLPTIEDANEFEDVEWSDSHDIWQNSYYLPNSNQHKATHWRRIALP